MVPEKAEYEVPVQRVRDLAGAGFEDRVPEMPQDVHQERQTLAKEVLALSRDLTKARKVAPPPEGHPQVLAPSPKELKKFEKLVRKASLKALKPEKKAAPAKSAGCQVKGCTEPGLWRLVCKRHLKGLPEELKKVLKGRPSGKPGRVSFEWQEAAAKASKILRRRS